MIDSLVAWLSGLPTGLATIILASLPVTELRLSIPIATTVWLLHPLNALGFSLIGNALPFFPLFFGLEAFRNWTARHAPWATRFIDRLIGRAEAKMKTSYARYGALALCLFVAIPLPLTGVYTATIAAVALKVPLKYAAIGILSGMFIAGVIVTALTWSTYEILF